MPMEKYKVQLSHEDRADALDSTDWYGEFEREQINHIATYLTAYEIPEDTVIFEELSTENFLGIIVKGRIKITKDNGEGSQVTLATLTQGKVFGEMMLVDKSPRSATATTEIHTHILALKGDDFERMVEETPTLAVILLKNIIKMVSNRLRRTSGQLVDYLPGDD